MPYDFHLKLDETEELQLQILVDMTGLNKSVILRQALRNYYKVKMKESGEDYYD